MLVFGSTVKARWRQVTLSRKYCRGDGRRVGGEKRGREAAALERSHRKGSAFGFLSVTRLVCRFISQIQLP